MLTVRQAAEQLQVSSGLVYALCSQRKLRHERYGLGRGKIMIPEDAIEEYRRAVTVQAVSEPARGSAPTRLPLKHLKL